MGVVLYTINLKVVRPAGDHVSDILASEELECLADLSWLPPEGAEVRLPVEPGRTRVRSVTFPGATGEDVEVELAPIDLPCPRDIAGRKSDPEVQEYFEGVVRSYEDAGWHKVANRARA